MFKKLRQMFVAVDEKFAISKRYRLSLGDVGSLNIDTDPCPVEPFVSYWFWSTSAL